MPLKALFKQLRFWCFFALLISQSISANGQSFSVSSPTFQNDTVFLCLNNGATVSFSASITSSDSVHWNFAGGSPSAASGAGPHIITYAAVGTYNGQVRKYSGGVLDTTYNFKVDVNQLAPVSFSPSKTTFCQSDNKFTLNGFSPSGGTFKGPGVSGNRFDPDAAGAGNKTIWYVVKRGGCKDSASVTMNVLATPNTTLSSTGVQTVFQGQTVYSLCPPSTPDFYFSTSTSSSQYDTYTLDFGDGSPIQTGTVFPSTVLHNFPVGLYTVTLTMTNTSTGCSRTKQVKVFNGSNPAGGIFTFGNNSGCLKSATDSIGFYFGISGAANNPPGTVYIVQFNDGSPAITFQHPPPDSVFHKFGQSSCGINFGSTVNSFGANLSVISPCGSTFGSVAPIYISRAPVADFEMDEKVCVNKSVDINDSSFGGRYVSSLNSNCSQPASVIWTITPNTYVLNSGNLGTRIVANDPAQWMQGAKSLNVTFTKTGIYTIKQVVGNSIACRIDSLEQTICVDSLPVASLHLSHDTVCSGDSITASFRESILGICDTLDIRWDTLGGLDYTMTQTGFFDTTQNYVFHKVGVYPIRMIAENECDSVQLFDTVVVQGIPTVYFPADTFICGLATVDFSSPHLLPVVFDSLSDVSYQWNVIPASGWSFSGGTSASSALAQIDFTQYGTFEVVLTVSSICGSYSDTMEVALSEKPVLQALVSPFVDTLVCPGTDLVYKAGATLGLVPYTYEWGSWSQGGLHSTDSIFLGNLQVDTTIYVKVTDVLGCSDSVGFSISILPPPTVDAGSFVQLCYNDSIQLNGAVNGGVGPFTYSWSPSAGLSDTTILNPWRASMDSSVTYTLTVKDSLGCEHFDTVTIAVFPQPNFSAGQDFVICLNQGDTTLQGHAPFGGSWIGTGMSGTLFSPTAAGLGVHTLVYSYTDANSCFFIDSMTATVIPQPQPDFGMDVSQGCSPLTVNLSDSSGAPTGHEWFINGQPFSTLMNPSATFVNLSNSADTIINIKLLFRAGSGCSDSITKQVTVFPRPLANFIAPSITCAGDSFQVMNTSVFKGVSATYRWQSSGGVGISDTTVSNPLFSFPDFQTGVDSMYAITLIVTTADGCSDTVTQNVLIGSRPVADFSLPSSQCTPAQVVPSDLSSGTGLNYAWSVTPSTNVTLSGNNSSAPQLYFTTPAIDSATYSITLLVTDTNGCVDSVTYPYTVHAQPVAGFVPSNRDSCGPLTVHFNDTASTGLSGGGQSLIYTWDLGNGQTSNLASPSATYVNNGVSDTTYFVTQIVENSLGCSDTIIDSITVHPDPRAIMQFTDTVDCSPFVIDSSVVNALTFPNANSSYTWNLYDSNFNLVQQFTGANGVNYTLALGGDSIYIQLIADSPFGCKADSTTPQLFFTIVNPVPDFEAIPDSICSGEILSLFDSSSAGVSHEWFINGTLFSTLQNPTITLVNLTNTTDSLVDIKLRITAGASGCADSVSKQVVIHPSPDAQFSLPAALCANDSVQPTNLSVGGTTYLWSVSDPAVTISDSALSQPFLHFPDNQTGTAQTYIVSLVLTNSEGCVDSVSQSIVINSRPVANFGLDANACGPAVISPSDSSSGLSLNYNWAVSPTSGVVVSGSNSSTPQFSFSSPTQDSIVYSIFLQLTDANGCIDTFRRSISIYPKPLAGFTPSNVDSCGPLTVHFANASQSKLTGQTRATMQFDWTFGNGQSSNVSTPVVTFTNTGVVDSTYFVQLIATNSLGCSDTLVDSITVRPDPRATLDTSTTKGCTPFTINDSVAWAFDYPQANSSYQWTVMDWPSLTVLQTFTGATALNHLMTTDGDTVLIRLVTTSPFGCKNDTAEQLFRTIPNPVPGFVLDTNQGCHPLTVNITDTSSPGLTYQWYINGVLQSTTAPNPSFTLTNTSTAQDEVYEIKLLGIAGTGCVDSISQTVTVYALPDPSFSATEVCGGDTTIFTNTTTTIDTIVQWFWDFDDGTSSTLKNPSHGFSTFGSYGVSLTATDSRGCSQTFVDTVIVRPNPVADFASSKSCGADTACLGRAFNFTDISTVASLGGNITTWEWDVLNDGTVEYTTQNPQHTFTSSGVYDVKLKVQTQYGCSDSIVRQVLVLDPILAYYTTDTTATCGPLDIVATDSSSGPIEGYLWELYTLDGLGNPQPVFFTSGQQNPNPVPTLLPSYVRDTTYVLRLTVFNCCDTVSFERSFTLKPLPVAGMVILPPVGCSGFKAEITIDGHTTGRPDSVIINYGDGTPTQIIPVDTVHYLGQRIPVFWKQYHTFVNNGNADTTYTVTLKAVNDCGDSTIQIPVLVHPNIVQAAFTYTPHQGCEDLEVTFTDGSFGGNTLAWCFDYDTLNHSSGQFSDSGKVVIHTYTDPGVYVVAQIVSDGCSYDTALTTITVWDAPEPDFNFNNNVCEGDSVFFSNLTVVNTSTVGIYHWYFGDGDSSMQKDPAHVYDSSGVFTVWLVAGSPNGCGDSISYQVTINDRPDVDFYVENVCSGDDLIFYDSTVVQNASITNTTWVIDTLGTFFSNPSPFALSSQGSYDVTLICTSSAGCTDSITKTVNVFEVPKARFSMRQDTTVDSCGNIASYIFTDSSVSSTPLQYLWDFNLANPGTMTSNLKVPGAQVFPDTGYFFISLTVWNGDSCWDTFTDTLFVKPVSRVNFSPLAPEACMYENIQFYDSTRYRSGSGNNVLTYLWDFGDGNTSTLKNPVHQYDSAGVYTIKLKVWDPSCVDSLSRQVVIHHTPEAVIAPGKYELCAREEIEIVSHTLLNFWNGDRVDSLIWNISDGRSIAMAADSSVFIEFMTQGTYTVQLIAVTDKGCRDTADADIQIKVHPTPTVVLDQQQVNARSFDFAPDVTDGEGGEYHWNFGNGEWRQGEAVDTMYYRYDDRLCRIDSTIDYDVSLLVINQIEDFGQCMDADTIQISMIGYHLNVPNAFAPDKINVEDANLFLPKGRLLGAYRMRVYDEWGNIVFETEELDENGSPVEGWDGTFNGEKMPTGAYVWTVDAEFNDGYTWPVDACNFEKIKAYGTVTLIR